MRERYCNNCGGKQYKQIGQNMVKCMFCGTVYVDEYSSKEEEILVALAYEKMRDLKFDEATADFDKIIALYPKSYEAYYGKSQSKNKIIYYSIGTKVKKGVSFFSTEIPNLLEDADYQKAIEFAPKEVAEGYADQAKRVQKIYDEWQKNAKNQEKIDIFFNYDGKNEDFKKIFARFNERQIKTFSYFDSVPDKKEKEAYVFGAMRSSGAQIICIDSGSTLSNPIVKNLYDRYRYRINTRERFSTSLVVVFNQNNITFDELKTLFPNLEIAFPVGGEDIFEDIFVYVKKILERKYNESVTLEKKNVEKETPTKKEYVDTPTIVPTDLGQYNVENVTLNDTNKIKWIFQCLKNGDFETAQKQIDELLSVEQTNGMALFANLLCSKKIRTEDAFFTKIENLDDKTLIASILKYSDASFANDFVEKSENLIMAQKSADAYIANFQFFISYNSTSRDEFFKSAEDFAIRTLNKELIDIIVKCYSANDTDRCTNFFFQLAQKTNDFSYYEKILGIDPGHMQSHYALFLQNFETVEEKLTYRDANAVESMLKFCDEEQGANFLFSICDQVTEVCFYDIAEAEKQFDFYLSYIADDVTLSKALEMVAQKLQEKGFFSLAEKYLSLAIKENKEKAELYWRLMQVKTHCRNENDLTTTPVKLADMGDWASVLSYATNEQTEKYAQIISNSNLTTATKVFRDEMLDKKTLKSKLTDFLIRNRSLLKDMTDKPSATYYENQLGAFEIYFDQIDKAESFEEYEEVVNKIKTRLDLLNLTLDTSINLAFVKQKSRATAVIKEEENKREEKYLTSVEASKRKEGRKKLLFVCLCIAPMVLVLLLLVFVAVSPKSMYFYLNQNFLLVLVILSVFLAIGNLIYDMVKKTPNKKWKVARLFVFTIGLVNLIMLLFCFYIFPPTLTITTAKELNNLVHNTSYCNIELEDDIDLSSYTWSATDFYGSFEGNGHTISGVKFKNQSGTYAFFNTFNGEISNLTIVLSEETYENVATFGGLIATNLGSVTRCAVSGSVTISSVTTDAKIGGVIGQLSSGTLSGNTCDLALTITTGDSVSIGGLVGEIAKSNLDTIFEDCTANVTLNMTMTDGEALVGGLVGSAKNTSLTIEKCYANFSAIVYDGGNTLTAGGLAGSLKSSITNSYCNFTISANNGKNTMTGGLVGSFDWRDCTLSACYSIFDAQVNNGKIGGLVGTLNEGTMKNLFVITDDITATDTWTGVYSELTTTNTALAPTPINSKVYESTTAYTEDANDFSFSSEVWAFDDTLPTFKNNT